LICLLGRVCLALAFLLPCGTPATGVVSVMDIMSTTYIQPMATINMRSAELNQVLKPQRYAKPETQA
jgi:hypothetical protein